MRMTWKLMAAVSALALTACETPGFTPRAPTAEEIAQRQRAQQISPLANLNIGNSRYEGPMPDYLAAANGTVNVYGDMDYVDTRQAIARTQEQARELAQRQGLTGQAVEDRVKVAAAREDDRLRVLALRDIRSCARVEVQKIHVAELRQQSAEVDRYRQFNASTRRIPEGIAGASIIGGAISAFSKFGNAYGWVEVLSSAIPGLANELVWDQYLTVTDLQNGLSVAESNFFLDNHDLWLDAMGEWCPTFMLYVDQAGTRPATTAALAQTPVAYPANAPVGAQAMPGTAVATPQGAVLVPYQGAATGNPAPLPQQVPMATAPR